MSFDSIDSYSKLLSEENQIKLAMSRLINLAYMEVVPISAMHFTPIFFNIIQKHHALDAYVNDSYEYDDNQNIVHTLQFIVRFNAKSDYNQNDIAWFSNLATKFQMELIIQEGIVQ